MCLKLESPAKGDMELRAEGARERDSKHFHNESLDHLPFYPSYFVLSRDLVDPR